MFIIFRLKLSVWANLALNIHILLSSISTQLLFCQKSKLTLLFYTMNGQLSPNKLILSHSKISLFSYLVNPSLQTSTQSPFSSKQATTPTKELLFTQCPLTILHKEEIWSFLHLKAIPYKPTSQLSLKTGKMMTYPSNTCSSSGHQMEAMSSLTLHLNRAATSLQPCCPAWARTLMLCYRLQS